MAFLAYPAKNFYCGTYGICHKDIMARYLPLCFLKPFIEFVSTQDGIYKGNNLFISRSALQIDQVLTALY
uniref:Uncharacterized protein n=1 Tax=Candidatus Kentrum sp. FW TaxID=2126338 RepID=A0A450SCM2_9GAMM|nr:MAG: hypothetical protein BECKFW1821B_GA0114236_100627 [Candidatus Kentron sp. FW]